MIDVESLLWVQGSDEYEDGQPAPPIHYLDKLAHVSAHRRLAQGG